jgi:MFS family permease
VGNIEVAGAPTAAASVVPRNALLPRAIFFGIVFVAAALQLSIGPLLPDYVHRFGLSALGAGAIVGAVGVTILGVALPAGHLADRFGARRLTIVAGSLLAIGALVQAAAPSFVLLIAARLVFGLGYGVLWTAGLAWLAGFGRSRSGIGVAVACSGVGGVAGPAFVGFLASQLGVAAPAAICGAVLVLLTLGFVACPSGLRAPLRSDRPVAAQLRFAFRDSRFIAALVAVVVAGISTTIATLIVPIDLHAQGFSASAIGIAFSFAGMVYVFVTVLSSIKQSGRFAASTAFAASFVIIVTLMPAALSATTDAVLAMLLASTAIRAILWTSAYPLGVASAEQQHIGAGVVTGMLNLVWAATTVVAPLVAGFMDARSGSRATVAVAQVGISLFLAAGLAYLSFARIRLAVHGGSVPRDHPSQDGGIERTFCEAVPAESTASMPVSNAAPRS